MKVLYICNQKAHLLIIVHLHKPPHKYKQSHIAVHVFGSYSSVKSHRVFNQLMNSIHCIQMLDYVVAAVIIKLYQFTSGILTQLIIKKCSVRIDDLF